MKLFFAVFKADALVLLKQPVLRAKVAFAERAVAHVAEGRRDAELGRAALAVFARGRSGSSAGGGCDHSGRRHFDAGCVAGGVVQGGLVCDVALLEGLGVVEGLASVDEG